MVVITEIRISKEFLQQCINVCQGKIKSLRLVKRDYFEGETI